MITPLDIENKKFSKQMMNGYSVEEVDEFLDELTLDYEKAYRQNTELKTKIDDLETSMAHYKAIEGTIQDTLVIAQNTAQEIKDVAKEQADKMVQEAEATARQTTSDLEQQINSKKKELEEIKKQFEVYKSKMESILTSQLELLKDVNEE